MTDMLKKLAALLLAVILLSLSAAADGEEIALCRQALLRAGAEKAVLCGSGSASFGVFPDAAGRDEAAKRLRVQLPDSWQVFVADTINEEEING